MASAPMAVSAFSPTLSSQPCRRMQNTRVAATATDAKGEVKTEVPVTRISVCAGELCQCQGEYVYDGGASDAAIAELERLGLPFPVDETPCLGACGMGTMIAIDYDNGDSIMTDGLESTLFELGIEQSIPPVVLSTVDRTESDTNTDNSIENEDTSLEMEATGNSDEVVVSTLPTEPTAATNIAPIQQKERPKPKREEKPIMADARERMREEAAEEAANPWVNMASYLAKKATSKMFGSD